MPNKKATARRTCGMAPDSAVHSNSSRPPGRLLTLLAALSLIAIFGASVVEARPEKIRQDVSYYSDDYHEAGGVRDIAEEKNYEEVYQFYTFYEVVYDAQARVKVFKEYKRGDVIREDRYRYGDDGALVEHTVQAPGKPAASVPVAPSG
jgi:hypothetical protein